MDLLIVGVTCNPQREQALLSLLARQPTTFIVRRCLSLDDLQRAGLHVGRARTAAAALRLAPDQPLTHPMPREAITAAHRRALRG